MPAPEFDTVDAATANLSINEGLQEQEDAVNAAIANRNADEESLEEDEGVPAPAFDAVDAAIANNANGFLQELDEAVDAANHNADEGELEVYDEEVVTELIHAALYQICLLLGSLVIGVSSVVAMYRVETSLNWWSEEAARGHVLLPIGMVSWLKWRAHAFLAANLVVAIVGFLGSLRLNLRLLLIYIIAEASIIPAPFIVVICCLLPHSISYYVYPNFFKYFLVVAWDGDARSLSIPMVFAGPVFLLCFTCAAKLYDAIEIAHAHIAAAQQWDRRRFERQRG